MIAPCGTPIKVVASKTKVNVLLSGSNESDSSDDDNNKAHTFETVSITSEDGEEHNTK